MSCVRCGSSVVGAAVADTDCIDLEGTGTGSDPITATPIISGDPDNTLECRATGLYASGGGGSGQLHAENVGNGADTCFLVNHAFSTRDVIVQVYENGDDFEEVLAGVKHADANNVEVCFQNPPAVDQYRVVVVTA